MNKSWKTSLFGYLAAIGAAVVMATRTGLIDGSHLPDWVNIVAGLCSVIGTAGLGQCARDHSNPSEISNPEISQSPNQNQTKQTNETSQTETTLPGYTRVLPRDPRDPPV